MSSSTQSLAPCDASKLAMLQRLEQHPEYSQRELSRALGLSLGKTHYVLKALLDKGLVKVRNFRRSDNKRGYVYFLTPAGAGEKLRLAKQFLARKEAEFEELEHEIKRLRVVVQTQPSAGS